MTAPRLTARNLTPLLLGLTLNPINSSIVATALAPIGDAFHVNAAVLGIPNGMNPVSEQATLALHAHVQQMGVASGLLRTAGYIGAMLASGLIAITFAGGASDGAMHLLAGMLIVLAALLAGVSVMRVARS